MEFLGSLGRSGLFDWLIQRLTAILLAIYSLFWGIYFLIQPEISFLQWKNLFTRNDLRFITLLVLVSLLIHAWIGIWVVITDYLKSWKLRYFALAIFMIGLSYCFLYGITLLWGH